MATVREVLFGVMRDLKLTRIFGNIGSTEEKMFADFPSDFEYVLALHESVAIAMADAYSQMSGKPVHVNLHTAASGNGVGAVTTAWHNRTPMVITAGQQTREMLLMEPYLTNKNPYLEFAPWVKWSYEPARPEDVPGAFLRAYAMAIQSPPGPVYLSLPMDDMDKECPRIPARRLVHPRISAGPDLLAPIAEAISLAQNPALIVGGSVDQLGGWDDVVRLAEKVRCKVFGAPMEGRPGFPEDHSQYQGLAAASAEPLREQLEGVDLVVVIGAPVFRFYPYTGGSPVPEGARLIHLTDSTEEAARAPIGESYLVDPARACATLADLVVPSQRPLPPLREKLSAPEPVGGMITADLLYATIAKLRPADSILVEEEPSTQSRLRDWLPTGKPRSFFSMFSGVLGYGLPAACGVSLAERDAGGSRRVISLQGDGSTQYTVQAFWNAAHLKLPILFIIFCNHKYAVLESYANFFGLKEVPGLEIPGIDTVALAKGYGCEGGYARNPDELESALQRGLAHNDGPYVLQVEILGDAPPLLGDSGPKIQAGTV